MSDTPSAPCGVGGFGFVPISIDHHKIPDELRGDVARLLDSLGIANAYIDSLRARVAELEEANRSNRVVMGGLSAVVDAWKDHCKRLEEAGDALQSAVVGVEGMTHWQWLAAAHEADLKWRKAKEAKP